MEKILGEMNKVLVEGGATASGTVPYLPLTELLNRAHVAPEGAGGAGYAAASGAGTGGTQ